MESTIDFDELDTDTNFKSKVQNLDEALSKIENSLDVAVGFKDFEALTTEEKVQLYNYLAYSTNSLYWMCLKLKGIDPTEHDISNELSRVRQGILREKQIKDLKLRPVVNKEVAKRFVRHELKIRRDDNEMQK